MKFQKRFLLIAILALSFGSASLVWAEAAPVFDADNLQQAFEGESQQQMQAAQEYPPAPMSQDEGFAPAQQEPSMEMTQVRPQPQMAEPNSPYLSVDQRVRKLEQQLHNAQASEGAAKIESLQQQVQALRGQVEQLTHNLQQMQAQQKNQYDDLDKRVSASAQTATQAPEPMVAANTQAPPSGADLQADGMPAPKGKKSKVAKTDVAAATATAVSASAAQPNVQEEQQVYQTAYNLIKQKRYTAAISALQRIVQKYPSGQFAANAHYWLGELYGLTGKTDQALVEFSTVAKSFPTSPRVADANLKVGLILAAQFNWPDAKTAFKKVISHYPGTASARVATEQLKQIKLAGH